MPNELELQPSETGQLRKHESLPSPDTRAMEQEIEKALYRVEQIDAKRITVAFEGKCVLLRGDVKTWREYEAAGTAAAGINGVTKVQNELRVAPWAF